MIKLMKDKEVFLRELAQPLVDRVSVELNSPFNALLLRLYFDGHDEIAWHQHRSDHAGR